MFKSTNSGNVPIGCAQLQLARPVHPPHHLVKEEQHDDDNLDVCEFDGDAHHLVDGQHDDGEVADMIYVKT